MTTDELLERLPLYIKGSDIRNPLVIRDTSLIMERNPQGTYEALYGFDDGHFHCQSTPIFNGDTLEKALHELFNYCLMNKLV